MITQEELKSLLSYDPETGEFTWLFSGKGKKKKIAGCLKKDSKYIVIRINKKLYKAHRLAWLYVYGVFPVLDIDHINGIRSDNKISNLREVPRNINLYNRQDVKGYTKHRNRYVAKISVNYKTVHLGSYKTKEQAKEAYEQAKSSLDRR